MFIHNFDKKHWGIIEANPFLNGCKKAQRGFLRHACKHILSDNDQLIPLFLSGFKIISKIFLLFFQFFNKFNDFINMIY